MDRRCLMDVFAEAACLEATEFLGPLKHPFALFHTGRVAETGDIGGWASLLGWRDDSQIVYGWGVVSTYPKRGGRRDQPALQDRQKHDPIS